MTDMFTIVPLAKLQPAHRNIRKTGATAGIEELAASIAAHGLLQNLTVRPVADIKGKTSDHYEVVAGGRRLAALKLLAKRKNIAKSYPVPCHVLATENAVEVALAENVVRVSMHPADQFDAFSALHAEGLGVDDIAVRFGIAPAVVRQRLKLAAVSSRLMEVYRTGEMNLEQLMAFAISDDHEAQERVWFESAAYDRHPPTIRRALTKALVEGGDRRARFIGAEAYELAGGTVIRDLFRPEDDGYFTDSALLDRLVAEKLAAEAEKVKAEGWSWVEAQPGTDSSYLSDLRRIPPATIPLSEEEQARLDQLTGRYDALIEELGEDPPAEADAELTRLQQEIDALSEGRQHWSPEEIARAGALIGLDYHGTVVVERGLVKREDDPRDTATEATDQTESDGIASRSKGGLPDALVEELTAHRTAALQAVLAQQPELAFTALVHAFVVRTFPEFFGETCLDVTPRALDLGQLSERMGESKAIVAMLQMRRERLDRLPKEDQLWPWLMEQEHDTKLALLAYCTSVTVNAVRRRHDREDGERLAHADLLATAAGLDMADWWQATKASYFGRVSKALILEAVAESVSKEAAENIATMKKDAMAVRAEERMAGTRWLPEILRPRSVAQPADGHEKPKLE